MASRYENVIDAWRLTASNSVATSGETSTSASGDVDPLAGEAAELRQALEAGAALEAHRGDREVQRGELGVVEVEIGQVVVVGQDPVRLVGAEPVDRSRP